MWPFKKKVELIDSTEGIMLSEDVILPLDCDSAEYENGLTTIRSILRRWIQQELDIAANTNNTLEGTLAYQLHEINLKMAPFASCREAINRILQDTDISKSGGRFFDVISLIYTTVPTRVLETYRGKFLYGMLYGLPRVINDDVLPSKEDWISLLTEHPWIPLLQIEQELFDTDLSVAARANALEESRAPTIA